MKFIGIILTVAIFAVYCAADSPKWHFFGVMGPNDRLLHKDQVKRESTFLRKTVVDYVYPSPAHPLPARFIVTAVNVLDQHDDHGDVSLKNGLGSGMVTVHLKSARNHGMDFIVEIYGRQI